MKSLPSKLLGKPRSDFMSYEVQAPRQFDSSQEERDDALKCDYE